MLFWQVKQAEADKANAQRAEWFSNPTAAYARPAVVKEGVGKYMAPAAPAKSQSTSTIDFGAAPVKQASKKPKKGGFGSMF